MLTIVLSDPQSWNLYAYASNNPLRYTDPTGHECNGSGTVGQVIGSCVTDPLIGVAKEAAVARGVLSPLQKWPEPANRLVPAIKSVLTGAGDTARFEARQIATSTVVRRDLDRAHLFREAVSRACVSLESSPGS